MNESNEEAYTKIDSLMNTIKITNLHIHNIIHSVTYNKKKVFEGITQEEYQKRASQKIKEMNTNIKLELDRFVSEYNKKHVKDLKNVKIIISLLFYRVIRNKIQDENFMRFQNYNFGVKFVFAYLVKECFLHIEIYRKSQGAKLTTLALKKLEHTFLYELHQKLKKSTDGGVMNIEFLEQEGKNILDDVTLIMSGERCVQCNKFMAFNNDLKVLLPPTVREFQESMLHNREKMWKYLHEGCI